MATLIMHESAVRIIVKLLDSKNIQHVHTPSCILLDSIPAKYLAFIKSIFWLSEFEHPDLHHYMGY